MAKKDKVPAASTADLAQALSKHGVSLYREYSGMALNKAQRNLFGRTNYAEDSNLKASKTSILAAEVMDDGLVLALVEKTQKTANPADGNIYRPVFFDVFGNIIYRPDVDDSFDTQKGAMADVWKQANDIEAVKATVNGAKAKQKAMQQEVDKFTELVEEIEE